MNVTWPQAPLTRTTKTAVERQAAALEPLLGAPVAVAWVDRLGGGRAR